uniref:Secreted protein n=1 Tax=Rodentolepis nana TaxID=102285 RepID=A0A0R3TE88_RODNA
LVRVLVDDLEVLLIEMALMKMVRSAVAVAILNLVPPLGQGHPVLVLELIHLRALGLILHNPKTHLMVKETVAVKIQCHRQ